MNPESGMSEIVQMNAQSLTYKIDGHRCTLEFDEDYLTCSRVDRASLIVTKTHLWRIMPELLVDRSVPESSRDYGRVSRYSLLAGVIVWFSEIRLHVPLLAPVLFGCAAYSLYRVLRAIWPLEKTKIMTDYAEELAVIPHHQEMTNRRKSFEEALLKAIRECRQKRDES
jgi:hypothetical protein